MERMHSQGPTHFFFFRRPLVTLWDLCGQKGRGFITSIGIRRKKIAFAAKGFEKVFLRIRHFKKWRGHIRHTTRHDTRHICEACGRMLSVRTSAESLGYRMVLGWRKKNVKWKTEMAVLRGSSLPTRSEKNSGEMTEVACWCREFGSKNDLCTTHGMLLTQCRISGRRGRGGNGANGVHGGGGRRKALHFHTC